MHVSTTYLEFILAVGADYLLWTCTNIYYETINAVLTVTTSKWSLSKPTSQSNKYKVAQIFLQNRQFYKGNTKQSVFLLLLLLHTRLTLIIFEKMAKLLSFSVKNVCQISTKVSTFQWNTQKIALNSGVFLTDRSSAKFVPKIKQN